MLLDILYPVLLFVIVAIGLGLASRTWTQKAAKAFARAEAADDQRAELLQGQLAQLSNLMTERLDQAQAAGSAREAQMRSQLALRYLELEAALAAKVDNLQEFLRKQQEHIQKATLDRDTQLHNEIALWRAEADSSCAGHALALEGLLKDRLAQTQATASASDAQLRSQFALRHSEFELATVARAKELEFQLTQHLDHQFSLAGQIASERHSKLLGEQVRRVARIEVMIDERMTQVLQVLAEKFGSLTPPSASLDPINQRRRMDRLQNDVDFVKNHMLSYLGEGTGLTHLIDETPIYVNTNDAGCPSNFINGGRYEEDYYQVLASFRHPDSVFLDIGANLGVFSLRLAPLIRHGKVYAFEPNSKIYDLFTRSIHLNGLKQLIEVFKLGVSDQNAELVLDVPDGHAGRASIQAGDSSYTGTRIKVRRIDDLLANLPRFDLAKIDVEGHELNVLRGMEELLRRSENAVILFEKLNSNSGIEGPLLEFFAGMKMKIFRIDGLALVEIDMAQFCASEAYFLAARTSTIGGEMVRNFINLMPGDLTAIACQVQNGALTAQATLPANSVIFYGPYWYLPRGSYNLSIVAIVNTGFKLVVAEKFGFPVAEFSVLADRLSFDFIVESDLTHFEVVAYASEGPFEFSIQRIRLTRVG